MEGDKFGEDRFCQFHKLNSVIVPGLLRRKVKLAGGKGWQGALGPLEG
jgi:hypothetical protein